MTHSHTSFTSRANIARLLMLGFALSTSATLVHADVSAQPSTKAPILLAKAEDPGKALLEAVKDGEIAAVEAALAAGANINAADKKGTTPLMLAAQNGKTELVELLLSKGADANLQDKDGRTALMLATQFGAPKKKKSGFGGLLGGLGGALAGGALGGGLLDGKLGGLGNLGANLLGGTPLDSLLGSNLSSLLGGGAFDLGGSGGWKAVLGTALQGDSNLKGALGLSSILGGDLSNMGAGGWTNLLSGVKGANPQVLSAISTLAGSEADKSALWGQFVNMASSGDQTGVAAMLQNPEMAPLLAQATAGLQGAAGELPGVATKNIVSSLLAKGANAALTDKKGRSAAELAQERDLTSVVELLKGN